MENIPSFTIDHIHLQRGIYMSRKDKVGSETITTFDIRMKLPNREPVLNQAAAHTIEHLAATFLRNDKEWSKKIIYWGPMGCLTGFYLLIAGDLESTNIIDLMKRTFTYIASYYAEVPGAKADQCGNYLLHDLTVARQEADTFLNNTLLHLTPSNLNYPTTKE